jgi:hypothetical protein
MGAGKRRKVNGERPGVGLTDRERECLAAVRRDVEAAKALHFLAQKTARTEEYWITLFVCTAWAEQSEEMLTPGESEPEELLRIAAHLRKTAGAIRKLNAQQYWRADCPDPTAFPREGMLRVEIGKNTSCEIVDRRLFNETKRSFQNLPGTLEMYAKSLRGKAFFEQCLRRLKRVEGRLRHQMESALQVEVCKLTRHKYREKIASILRVVNPMAGLPAVEAESLRKREQRKRK